MSARLALGLAVAFIACATSESALHAQTPVAPAPHAAKLPPMPVTKSPVDLFRDLLAMSSAAREQYLTNRPPEIRRRILEKLGEYESMSPAARELRLSKTQLRWYLLPLMQVPADSRAAQLAIVPEAERQLVSDHLREWDQLPSDEQKAILKYENTMEQFMDNQSNASTKPPVPSLPPPAAIQNLGNFLKLPADERSQMYADFQRFFGLTDAEKQKTLGALPDKQREQSASAMQTVAKLSPADRAQYVDALSRFSKMSEAERKEFMKNAEHWRQLSPTEKQAWRGLVKRLAKQPPVPAGLVNPPVPPILPLQANTTNLTNSTP
jgi:hypothetical protein